MAESNKERRCKRRAHDDGLTRELGATRDTSDADDPSRGGSRGYNPLWIRRLDVIEQQVQQQRGLSAALAIGRWTDERIIEPHEMHGGGQETTKLVGRDLMLMAIYLVAYPDAENDEIAAFIANHGGDLYADSTISRQLREFKDSRKEVASIETYQTFVLPANILRKKDRFFNLPPPLGVNGLARRGLCDTDECVIFLEKANRSSKGLSHPTIRMRKPGHYGKGRKLTVLLCIEPGDPALAAHIPGSIARPRRWFEFLEDGGTTTEAFAGFVNTFLTSMEGSGLNVDLDRTLLWDNLRSHHLVPLVTWTVYGRPSTTNSRFRSVPRPPYMPKYGPIEYAFAELGGRLQQRVRPDWNYAVLRQEVTNLLSEIGMDGGFNATFAHCGY
jgi:hypothetical protein